MKEEFNRLLLGWYGIHARVLPWRKKTDAYAVWVSEIMLQQTRVDTVIPYYQKWMNLFPDVQSLAAADEQQVLAAWEGLGYYSRARNMLKTARLVCEKYDGRFPSSTAELKHLPGIGRYTAAAVASIGYNADEAVLDGNVKRVFARIYQIDEPVNTPGGEKILWPMVQALLPAGRGSDFNQALMDLGATICIPQNPACEKCPVSKLCVSFRDHRQEDYPKLREKPPIPHYTVSAAVLRRDGRVLIARRPSKGLLGGLWEFPGGKVEEGETHASALVREIHEELGVEIEPLDRLGTYRHAYTHFKVTLQAWFADLKEGEPAALEASEIRWAKIEELAAYPMGKIDRAISTDLEKQLK